MTQHRPEHPLDQPAAPSPAAVRDRLAQALAQDQAHGWFTAQHRQARLACITEAAARARNLDAAFDDWATVAPRVRDLAAARRHTEIHDLVTHARDGVLAAMTDLDDAARIVHDGMPDSALDHEWALITTELSTHMTGMLLTAQRLLDLYNTQH